MMMQMPALPWQLTSPDTLYSQTQEHDIASLFAGHRFEGGVMEEGLGGWGVGGS